MGDMLAASKTDDIESKSQDHLWKEYLLYIDLYKYYITTMSQINIFHLSLTGGVYAYIVNNEGTKAATTLKYVFVLPVFVSVVLFIMIVMNIGPIKMLYSEIDRISTKLGLRAKPTYSPMTVMAALFAIVNAVVAFYLVYLMFVR